MKRLLFLLIAVALTCSIMAKETKSVTITPSNPRMYSRFIYNYRAVLQDFEIDPDISRFVSTTGLKSFPAFIIRGNDGALYAVSAADVVAFTDKVEVTVTDSASKTSYPNLEVINISEKLNLAVTRLPVDAKVKAIEIDSVWFSDESEQYSLSAQMFLKGVPMQVAGDASSLSVLYNRLANSAAEGYYYILPNLSYKYLYNKSAEQIANGIDSLSEADYQLFRNLNKDGDVISAMRLLSGDMAARNMKLDFECVNTKINDYSVVLEGKNGENITFVKEFGAWRILTDTKPVAAATTNSATYVKTQNGGSTSTGTPSSSIIGQDIIGTLVTGKVMVPYNFCNQGVAGSFSIGYALKFISFEAVFEYNSLGVYRTRDYDPYFYNLKPYNSDYHYSNFVGVGIRLGGFLPININGKLTVAPTVKFEWESPFFCRNAYYYINAISPIAGADLFVRLKNYSWFFVGVQYEHKFFFDYYNLSLKKTNMGYINANFGFVF